jgi:hypothetical protein
MFKKLNLTRVMAVVALAAALALVFMWPKTADWPQFAATENNAPATVVQVKPDFGYRTGDLIPVTLYIKEAPGTQVDIGSLALEGNFELVGEPDVFTKDLEDGSRLIRVRLTLQSFAFAPSVQSRVSMIWTVDGQRDTFELPETVIKVFTSKTWDGREELQEGEVDLLGSPTPWVNLALFVLSVAGIVWTTRYIRRVIAGLPKDEPTKFPVSPRVLAKQRFDAVWAKIEAGDLSEENFKEINIILRQFLKIETILRKFIPLAVGEGHPYIEQIVLVFGHCERVIFEGEVLNAEELAALKAAFDEIILLR